MQAILMVLDSVGIGAAPDADVYGDAGANTLANLADAVGGVSVPTLARMGLGNIPGVLPSGRAIRGVSAADFPAASFGALREMSKGKDTTTGHWEMAGLLLERGFHLFPHRQPCFPAELTDALEPRTRRAVIGNKHASGTVIIEELGHEHMRDGSWIAYTSADSVFQVAAHEEIIPLEELYRGCEVARELCNELFVGRVIARPFVGEPGSFRRTQNRRDYSYPLPEPTILDRLSEAGHRVTTVGKLDDVFDHRGMTDALHVENNADAQRATLDVAREDREGLVFVNLIDFDMLYGHRRDARGYASALEKTDAFLDELVGLMMSGDVLIVTADHGNDPTFSGTDHTREYVPLLVYRPGRTGANLGIRNGFYDIAQSLAALFKIDPMPRGRSFL